MPKKKRESLRFNTIKENESFKMRSSESVVKRFLKELDSAKEAILQEASKLAKEDKRNTVMERD